MEIGNKLLELRKKNHFSQEELANKIGVTRQTISKWELNETSPDLKQAKALAAVFRVSLDELAGKDVQNILIEKISNTEKLAGLILKILKMIRIFLIGMIIILIISYCLTILVYHRSGAEAITQETSFYLPSDVRIL